MTPAGANLARRWAWITGLAMAGFVLLHGVAWLVGIHLFTREVDTALARAAADAELSITTRAVRWRGYPARLAAGLVDAAIKPAAGRGGAEWTVTSPDITVSWAPTAGRVLQVTGPIVATFGGAAGDRVTATVHIAIDDTAVATGGDRVANLAVRDLAVFSDTPVLQVGALDAALSLQSSPSALTSSTLIINAIAAHAPMLGTISADRLTADVVATPPLPLGLAARAATRWRTQNGSLTIKLAAAISGYDTILQLQGGLDPQLLPRASGRLTASAQAGASPSLTMLPLLFAIGMRQEADGTMQASISLADGRLNLGRLPPIPVGVIDWR
mgnify:FL=1